MGIGGKGVTTVPPTTTVGGPSVVRTFPAITHRFAARPYLPSGITFARDSTVNGWTEDSNGNSILTEFTTDTPAFVIDPATGQSLGYRALAGSTNKCTNHNLNPDAALANISASAGTLERVDDSANLPFSNQFDGNAFHLNNGTGGSVTITVTGQCGNTNAHSIGVLCRFTGTAPTVQLTGGDGSATCNNDYDETKSEDITPSATTDQWQLVVPDGTEVWFVANQLEEGAFISSWIETEGATGSTAADAAEEPLPASCQDGFVWVVHARTPSFKPDGTTQYTGSFNDGTLSNRIVVDRQPDGQISLFVQADSVVIINVDKFYDAVDGTDFKMAFASESGDYRVAVNGQIRLQRTDSEFPQGLNKHNIGVRQTDDRNWNSTIALDELHSDPENWTDADLQAATS